MEKPWRKDFSSFHVGREEYWGFSPRLPVEGSRESLEWEEVMQ
jgi:hypothetical protein